MDYCVCDLYPVQWCKCESFYYYLLDQALFIFNNIEDDSLVNQLTYHYHEQLDILERINNGVVEKF